MGRISPTEARFTQAGTGDGMYESWYVRLVSPDGGPAVWIRYTIDKVPGREATGTLWFSLFDPEADRPVARREAGLPARTAGGSWVRIGDSAIGPEGLKGGCHEASWDLEFSARAAPLFHLSRPRLYEFPVPKTKPISPAPDGVWNGEVSFGDRKITVDGWRGMIGHNWGSEHAERWIWLHGIDFEQDPGAWIDIVMGRIRVAGKLLPWVANGAVRAGGETRRIGGLFARGVEVEERPERLKAALPVAGGSRLELEVDSPPNLTVGWRYGDPSDPAGEAHEVANCSAARMAARVDGPEGPVALTTSHGAVYELGMTETGHGVPISDGLPG